MLRKWMLMRQIIHLKSKSHCYDLPWWNSDIVFGARQILNLIPVYLAFPWSSKTINFWCIQKQNMFVFFPVPHVVWLLELRLGMHAKELIESNIVEEKTMYNWIDEWAKRNIADMFWFHTVFFGPAFNIPWTSKTLLIMDWGLFAYISV